MKNTLRIHPSDSVEVALFPVPEGTVTGGVRALQDIPQGHKIAVRDIRAGEKVIKYGFPIGIASQDIPAGSHVHTHNLKTGLSGGLEYAYTPVQTPVFEKKEGTFQGFERAGGRAGIRNDIWIIPTVGCVNGIAKELAKQAQAFVKGSVQDVLAFPHPYGCSQLGDDQENTRRILARLACHPNAGGVLVLGLGCENSGTEEIRSCMEAYDPARVRFMVCQEQEDEISTGLDILKELISIAAKDQRTPVSLSRLTVGLKCGGSDGLSGITANPVIGRFSDLLSACGGTTLLTEVPEMFGAETILMDRCPSKELFDSTVSLINDFKAYYTKNGLPVYENPSPGNKAGGITTLEDKSLGCTQKSGTGPVRGVLKYGESVKEKGLNLLCAPGNDLVAATALAASGAQLILFSTGRGTPFSAPVPTLKISSSTPLALKKRGWIDFDAGRLISQDLSLNALAGELLQLVIETAGGKATRAEENGCRDLAIWKTGVTL
ncbi:MAG: altronate hydrolase [Clostridiales bacterium]|nr:altronate hydrolase [Clostridiales bacterium]